MSEPGSVRRDARDPGFATSLRRDAGEPGDLGARIEAQLRERIEEALDLAGLDALVQWRRARGLPEPRPDSAHDRDEFRATVRALLVRLGAELGAVHDGAGAGDELAGLIAAQAALARSRPDYWQRFEEIRVAWTAEGAGRPADGASGGQRGGLLARLLGRG